MSTRRIIRTERFSVSWRRDTTLAGILRRLCRLNWKMLISIQPRRDIPCRARHTGSLLPHSPTLFAPLPLERPFALPSILHDEIKAREGKFYFAPGVSLPVGRRKDRIGELISNARLIRSLAWKKRTALSARRIFTKREWERVSIVWENRRDCLSMKILKFDWTRSCSFYLLTPRVIALLSFSVLVWQGLFPLSIILSPLWI